MMSRKAFNSHCSTVRTLKLFLWGEGSIIPFIFMNMNFKLG